jgi:hypothetical protein
MLPPFCYLLLQGGLAAVTIHGTKTQSYARILSLATILWLTYLVFASVIQSGSNGFSGTLAGYGFLYTAHLVNILWINGVSSEDFSSSNNPSQKYPFDNHFLCVLHLVFFNYRGIRTPWEIKNVTRFSTYYPGRFPNNRTQFLIRQIAVFTFQCLVLDLFQAQFSKFSPEARHRLFGPGLEYTYFSATREQWIFRIVAVTAMRWFVHRCSLSLLYNFASIVGVATGIFVPADFPPFMGSMLRGYTLRGYWG